MSEYQFKSGDILAFSGRSLQSDVINICTYGIPRWSISHVGIAACDYPPGLGVRQYLFEALPRGVRINNIKLTIEEYNGRVWVYPLYRKLYSHEKQRLSMSLLDAVGVPYDKPGAIRTAGIVFAAIQALFRGQDLSTFFCSELIASKLSDIGIHPAINASRWNPNCLVRNLLADKIIHKPIRLK